MRFIDECDVRVEAGDGGKGAIAFRREKFVPFGGPAGGDGGRGGDVVLVGDSGLGTLYDLTQGRVVRAESGEHGGGKDCYGRAGRDLEVRVPVGTQIFLADTGEPVGEIVRPNSRIVVAKGGQGGRGNIHFASSTERAPRRAEPGVPGERFDLRLELKVMADVGLLGFPNVGKSTFISSVSRAHPKVADYPFTTLEPHLGVVTLGEARHGLGRTFVVADIPGLIPGASQGAGLGVRFLRHLERTRLLLHLVTVEEESERSPIADYHALRKELFSFDPELAKRPEVVAMTKADLPHVRDAYEASKAEFAALGIELWLVSAATHENVDHLLIELEQRLVTP
jgi:GTP-binding protein